jgi:NitT/TauT family transport system substrate-binding protein
MRESYMTRLQATGLGVVLILLSLAAWLLFHRPVSEAGSQAFTLNVDTWVGYAPFWLAREKGFFQAEGLDVNIITMPDVGQRKASMIKGATDGIAETVDMLVLDREEGVPSIAVMEIDLSNGADGILTTDGIKTVEDLRGRAIAVQRNYASEALLNYLLKKHGLKPSDVQKIDTEGGAAGAAFVSGQVDVAVTFQPWLSKSKERRGGKILVSSADVPGVIVDILSIREQYLQQHPETVKKIMRSWFRALDFWKSNPAEANIIMARHYSSTAEEFSDLISGLTWPSFEENRTYFGTKQNPGHIYDVANTFVDIFLDTTQIKARPDMTRGIDEGSLKALYDQK